VREESERRGRQGSGRGERERRGRGGEQYLAHVDGVDGLDGVHGVLQQHLSPDLDLDVALLHHAPGTMHHAQRKPPGSE